MPNTKKAKTNGKANGHAKKTVAKKAATKKVAAKKAPVSRENSKTSKVIAMMKKAGGVTREQILKLTGWPSISVQHLAKSSGVKLKVDDSKRPFRYSVA